MHNYSSVYAVSTNYIWNKWKYMYKLCCIAQNGGGGKFWQIWQKKHCHLPLLIFLSQIPDPLKLWLALGKPASYAQR